MIKPFVNLQQLASLDSIPNEIYSSIPLKLAHPGDIFLIKNFIPPSYCDLIVSELTAKPWISVGLDGILENTTSTSEIGSHRLSAFNPNFADYLWKLLLATGCISKKEYNSHTFCDFSENSKEFNPFSVNPLLRFIKYPDNGKLVAHYDAPFVQSELIRSMQSLVIYLTDSEPLKGGCTRFLADSQNELPFSSRNFSDKLFCGQDSEALHQIQPSKGTALLFDHRILHDSSPILKSIYKKIILRTDVLFKFT